MLIIVLKSNPAGSRIPRKESEILPQDISVAPSGMGFRAQLTRRAPLCSVVVVVVELLWRELEVDHLLNIVLIPTGVVSSFHFPRCNITVDIGTFFKSSFSTSLNNFLCPLLDLALPLSSHYNISSKSPARGFVMHALFCEAVH